MPLPALATKSGTLVRDGIYIIANLKADLETADLVEVVAPDQAALKKQMAVRTDTDTTAIEASAVADARLNALKRSIVHLGTRAFGFYLSRKADGYLRLLPQSPSQIIGLPVAQRTVAFDRLKKAAQAAETPKELGPTVKELVAAYDAFTGAAATDKTADEALRAALALEKKAVDAWHTAVRRLRGRLIDRFPRDSKRVGTYFPKGAAKVEKVVKVEGPGPA